MRHLTKALTLGAIFAPPALADLSVRFDEGAPKDRFSVTNTSGCALPATRITIDIGTAPAGLVFDVTGSGAGVSVYQPFELIAGAEALVEAPTVLDGDTALQLNLLGLNAGETVAFTIDVDDTAKSGRQTVVSGSEIAGATVLAEIDSTSVSATLDQTAGTVLPLPACLS